MTDNVSLNTAFLLAGGIYFMAAVVVAFPWLKQKQ